MSLIIFGYVLPFVVFWAVTLLSQNWSKPVDFQVKDLGLAIGSLVPFLNVAFAVVMVWCYFDLNGDKVLFTFNKRKNS